MPRENEVSADLEELREGVGVATDWRHRITVSRGEDVEFRLPYSDENPLDNRLEVTLYTTDGTYNSTLVVADQEVSGDAALLRFTGVPRDLRYGASVAWIDVDTGVKAEVYQLFDDIPWDCFEPDEEEQS